MLGLWIPFTVIVGLLVAAEPDCTSSRAAICTPLGHLASVCAGTLGALFGLGILVVGCWVHPRRDHAYWVVVGLTVAAVGFLTMIALLNGARAGH